MTSIPFDELTGSADDTINPRRDGIDSNVSKSRLTVGRSEIMRARKPVTKKCREVLLEFAVIDQRMFWRLPAAEIHDAEGAGQRDIGRQPVAHHAEVCQPGGVKFLADTASPGEPAKRQVDGMFRQVSCKKLGDAEPVTPDMAKDRCV